MAEEIAQLKISMESKTVYQMDQTALGGQIILRNQPECSKNPDLFKNNCTPPGCTSS